VSPGHDGRSARLEADLDRDDSLECERLAILYEKAGEVEQASRYLVAAGRRAIVAGDLRRAGELLQRAAVLGQGDSVALADALGNRVHALAIAGRSRSAAEEGTALLALLAERCAPASELARAHLHLPRATLARPDVDSAVTHLHDARELSGREASIDAALSAEIDVVDAAVRLRLGERDAARAIADALLKRDTTPLWVRGHALDVLGQQSEGIDPRAASETYRRKLALAEQHRLSVTRARAGLRLATAHAEATSDRSPLVLARDLAARIGATALHAAADMRLAWQSLLAFDLGAARDAAERAVAVAADEQLASLPMALLARARLDAMTASLDRMETGITEAIEAAKADPDRAEVAAVAAGEVQAMAAFIRADLHAAASALEEGIAHLAWAPRARPWPFQGLWLLLHTLDKDDFDPDEGAKVIRSVAGGRVLIGYRELARAVRAARGGRTDTAIELWSNGDAYLLGAEWHRHHARALVAAEAIRDGWGTRSRGCARHSGSSTGAATGA